MEFVNAYCLQVRFIPLNILKFAIAFSNGFPFRGLQRLRGLQPRLLHRCCDGPPLLGLYANQFFGSRLDFNGSDLPELVHISYKQREIANLIDPTGNTL